MEKRMEDRENTERMHARLQQLATSAADLAKRYDRDNQMDEKLLENGLFLERRRFFPEAREPSPYGRLVVQNGHARVVRPAGDGSTMP
jgi:hypothetical protein